MREGGSAGAVAWRQLAGRSLSVPVLTHLPWAPAAVALGLLRHVADSESEWSRGVTSDKRELRRWDQLDLGPLPMAASVLGGYPWQQLERVHRADGTGDGQTSGHGDVFVTALPPPSKGLTLCFSGKCGDGLPSPSGAGSGSGDFVLRATGVSAGWIGAVTRGGDGDAVGEGETGSQGAGSSGARSREQRRRVECSTGSPLCAVAALVELLRCKFPPTPRSDSSLFEAVLDRRVARVAWRRPEGKAAWVGAMARAAAALGDGGAAGGSGAGAGKGVLSVWGGLVGGGVGTQAGVEW